MSSNTQEDIQSIITQRIAQLPKVVQEAILSADVEKHMRELAAQYQLHFDQWAMLENEVMFALLGMQPIEQLAANIEKHVGLSHETAAKLAESMTRIVFGPIRAELQRSLSPAPNQQPAHEPQIATATNYRGRAATSVDPGTPPPPAPEGKAVRAAASEEYVAGQASHSRRTIDGDPYRESIL